MEDANVIGQRIRELRTMRGLTQQQLAAPRYSAAYVSSIEAGRRRPSAKALEHFAAKLGVDADELLGDSPSNLGARLLLLLQEARMALSDGRLEEANRGFRSAARQARRYGLAKIEARAELGLGLLGERGGDPEGALEHFQRAEAVLRTLVPAIRAEAVAGQARCHQALGDLRFAIHLLKSHLEALERADVPDPDALVRLHASLLDAYLDAGLHGKAAASAEELDRLSPRLKDPLGVAHMHMYVARMHLSKGATEEALRSLQRAEDAYRQLELRTETGYAHLARGYVLSRQGRLPEARGELEQASAIFEGTGDTKDLTRALNELARVERLEGNPGQARELLERSIGLLGEADAPILAWAERELGVVLAQVDPSAAEKHLRRSIELFQRTDQPVEVAFSYRELGDLLRERGDAEAGCRAYREGITALEPSY
jgi:tetratricopeptide (TPR) repeat protein